MAPTKHPKVRPPPETVRASYPHPSVGGSRGYPLSERQCAMHIRDWGHENDDTFGNLRDIHSYPSKRSTHRWDWRRDEYGTLEAFEMTGNNPAIVLRGHMQLMVAVFRIMFPKCTQAEMNVYLFNSTPPFEEARFYSRSQITCAEDRLGLARKRGSTTARQANLPINLAKMDMFRTLPYPAGSVNISLLDMIDFDQAAIFIETTARGIGKAHFSRRVVEEGPYGHSEKLTLTMAVCGSGERFLWLDVKNGTTTLDTVNFLTEVMDGLEDGNEDRRRCFMADSIISHKHPLVCNTVFARGHRFLFRPPYAPWIAPIEYVFNVIQCMLALEMHNIMDIAELRRHIDRIVLDMGEFAPYFIHCNYNL